MDLTDEQKQKVKDLWNSRLGGKPPTMEELTKAAFPDSDGKGLGAISVKRFLATIQVTPAGEKSHLELTEDQKLFIKKNVKILKPIEIARMVFKNPSLTRSAGEVRVVYAYLRTLPEFLQHEDVPDYSPPCTLEQAIARVNKYIHNAVDKNRLTTSQKTELTKLIDYLKNYRLNYTINSLSTKEDRELFESEFIGYVYDKPDLTHEEITSYINLTLDIVNLHRQQSDLERLRELSMTMADETEEGQKMSMTLIQMMNNIQSEYDANKKRQQKMIDDLQGTRKERLQLSIQKNASVLSLVEAWKNPEMREAFIRTAEAEEQAIAKQIDEIDTVKDLKGAIFGISKQEILHGK